MAIQSNGTGGGDWHLGASWNGGSVPGSGDDAIIVAGDTIVCNQLNTTYTVKSLVIQAGAVLTHTNNTGQTSPDAYRVSIVATGDNGAIPPYAFDIQGNIDVNTYGYSVGPGGGADGLGGTHGGAGGSNSVIDNTTATNDSVTEPNLPGSAGHSFFHGGGCVKLVANTGDVLIDGNITAVGDNNNWAHTTKGAGSGGAIWIDASSGDISGSGTVSANGGATVAGSVNGGGGRIAFYYATANFGLMTISAMANFNLLLTARAAGGTIYYYDTTASEDLLVIAYVRHNLAADFCALTRLPTGAPSTYDGLEIYGRLCLESSLTINGDVMVGESVTPSAGCITCNDTTTTDDTPNVELTVTGTLTIDTAGRIDTYGRGYLGGWSGNNLQNTGKTNGNADGSTTDAGGSHGGAGESAGGIAAPTYGGPLPGEEAKPTTHGGGGGADGGGDVGGDGGGRIYIKCTDIVVDGDIASNGSVGVGGGVGNAGGGAGGSIYIETYEYSPVPASGQQGAVNLDVVFTGIGTQWVDGTSTVTFSGAGITQIQHPTNPRLGAPFLWVTSPTSATIRINIGAGAALGVRTVTITGGAGVDVITSPGAAGTISADGGTDGGAAGGGGGGRIAIYCEAALIDPGVTITVNGGA